MSSTLKQFLHKPKLVIPIAVVAVIGIIALITMAIKSNDDVKAAPGPLDVEVVQVKQDEICPSVTSFKDEDQAVDHRVSGWACLVSNLDGPGLL